MIPLDVHALLTTALRQAQDLPQVDCPSVTFTGLLPHAGLARFTRHPQTAQQQAAFPSVVPAKAVALALASEVAAGTVRTAHVQAAQALLRHD